MRVKELILHNFRGIKDLHLVFNDHHNVVVLVGVNGVGKSSILDCINLLIKHYVNVNDTITGEIDKHTIFFNDILLESDIHTGGENTKNTIKISSDSGMEKEWDIARFRGEEAGYNWSVFYDKSQAQIKVIYQDLTRDNHGHSRDNYFYYLANRQLIEKEIDPILFCTNSVKDIIDFKDFSKWFKETEDLENQTRLSDNIEYRHPGLKAVKQSISLLLGQGYSNLTFKRAINKLTIKKSNHEIAVDLLSDGEKSLLAIVGELSKRLADKYKYLENPPEAPALVLIDEIELHLHPAWQRMIIPRLTQIFPNCQFIITTHSPQVLSHVDPECIHILDYEGDNVVVKRPENSFGLDSNRILEDILGVPKRPQEIQDEMLELFRTINNNDLETAKKIVQELGDKIGINEPELVKAEATIKRREIIGR
jgi:predicted ATP-binding protein involved in virulence